MVRLSFTSNLQRHVPCPEVQTEPGPLMSILQQAFVGNPRLRGYILDDQNRLRQHVMIFINGSLVVDRIHLTDSVADHSEVFVMQALSGG